jgi:hypothetical protein
MEQSLVGIAPELVMEPGGKSVCRPFLAEVVPEDPLS